MAGLTCGQVRELLEGAAKGSTVPGASPELWESLRARGAVAGDAAHPRLTLVGEHTLRELALRAYRSDPLPLSAIEEELGRTLQELDRISRTTAYFLGELGPITPSEALPLLRPVAVGLANRRSSPEELAETFRQVWGSAEVLGGDSRDRLLAAELLCASGLPIGNIYAAVVDLAERLRDALGRGGSSNACAAILAIGSKEPRRSLETLLSIRTKTATDEAAALLACDPTRTEELLAARARHSEILFPIAKVPLDAEMACTYLAIAGQPTTTADASVQALVSTMERHFQRPLMPSAVLAARSTLSPAELSDWLSKATAIVTEHKLAPTEPELRALALALVHGLHPESFATPESWETRSAEALVPMSADLPTLVALHAWIYRPLIATVGRTKALPSAS